MKQVFFIFLVLFGFINETKSQSETDTIPSRVIFAMPGITLAQLNNIKTTLIDLPEITDALFISGSSECLILDIDTSLGNNINYYSDLTKRFTPDYNIVNLRIKDPLAFNEIFSSSPQSIMNILK